ncbi:TPA: hypothetical protein DDW69_03465 [candidate division CPR2 bacterium]|uniref:Replication-relaxation n=1 Tax=candidate division CPR2 bacterium GW2011_GWC1_41_48 TaxID=1618344 RepID=A0A0G0WAE8_UNCC2|nr:MAG: hypothetical protein UT47_C0003G0113 [candidate division CPR2 bacterium GW2011_GWC2_39_35]KKR27325.1 MAG: hypothetical protein UT60_C0053G0002 [candidate division CPR2 bacterium GW2011_GWD2_39_7]KKS09052.1 MAG: hypothetical protein UU65_C0003G0107 [candidate division CPR2 bacterium GW2011_GWC1_41_48]OGB70701.1 MAG: hypothetical protein A2Y26_02300 [candidate division CPR2 bacterium GWD2_39_7]HBG81873.1 hypothetical protein [candidate division CPR2 bacterium]
MLELSPITKKQQEILILIYRFRFLNRIQIQTLLKHKNKKTINVWLNDLRKKEYVERIYSNTFGENTKPAIYYLSLNGIRFLKTTKIEPEALKKFYYERIRTETFIERSILLGDIYLELLEISESANNSKVSEKEETSGGFKEKIQKPPDKVKKVKYEMCLSSDYAAFGKYEESDLPFEELVRELKPHAYILRKKHGHKKHYFLEILSDIPLPYLRQRLKRYLKFFESFNWEYSEEPTPVFLIICPNKRVRVYVAGYIRKALYTLKENEEEPTFDVQITTVEEVRKLGITGEVWRMIR